MQTPYLLARDRLVAHARACSKFSFVRFSLSPRPHLQLHRNPSSLQTVQRPYSARISDSSSKLAHFLSSAFSPAPHSSS